MQMSEKINAQGTIKYMIGWIIVLLSRLIPFRPPNVEPLLATIMPFSKRYGWLGGFVFGLSSIVIFDIVTGKVGVWTMITGVAYGLVAIGASLFFRDREASRKSYVQYAIVGTIAYDTLTGLTIGPLFFGQTLMSAFVGQIPFTLWHLGGNIVFAAVLSPLIYRWVIDNKNLELTAVLRKISFA
jgi:hypothetical protein